MKKLYTLFLIINAVLAFAQPPQRINYQGILRRANGEVIPDTLVTLKFVILDASSNFYTEIQSGIGVNKMGLFSTQIGSVTALPLSWPNASYSLQVSMEDGSNSTPIGAAQPLASVPFALNASSPSVSVMNNTLLTVGTSTAQLPATAGNQSLIALGGGSISISNGNTVTVWPTITGAGVTTVTPNGNGYVISSPNPSTSVQAALSQGSVVAYPLGSVVGLAQVVGSPGGGNSVIVAPTFNYDQNTGNLVLESQSGMVMNGLIGQSNYPFTAPTGSFYSYAYNITPNLSMPPSNLLLQSGPPTNVVDFKPYLVWRQGTPSNTNAAVVRLANPSDQLLIGFDSSPGPTVAVHIDGFTKLGIHAPAIQIHTITAFTAGAINTTTTIALGSYSLQGSLMPINAGKIISVSVLVQLSGGEWVHENSTAILNTSFDWHLASSGTSIVITNLATSSAILNRPVKISITHGP